MTDLYQICPKCFGGTCQHTPPCKGCLIFASVFALVWLAMLIKLGVF